MPIRFSTPPSRAIALALVAGTSLLSAHQAEALSISSRQSAANEWTYDLTFDPWDNYCIFQPTATITISGLLGVVDATPPTSTDFAFSGLDQLNRAWVPQVLDLGTRVVWTHIGPGTGNFTVPMHVYGFKIHSNGSGSGQAALVTSGFSYDTHTPLGNGLDRDIAIDVEGPTLPALVVTPLQQSFISTDTVRFRLSYLPNTVMTYSVVASDSVQNVPLVVQGQASTDAYGDAIVQIKPSSFAALTSERSALWVTGSLLPSPPLVLQVTAAGGGSQGAGSLGQDGADILRQEYVDFGLLVPNRNALMPNLGLGDQGNYHLQLNLNIPKHYSAILAEYRKSRASILGKLVKVPADASVVITSGYRNPRLNALFTSNRNDPHTKGRALDLAPLDFSVVVNGTPFAVAAHPYGFNILNAVLKERLGYNPVPEFGGTRSSLNAADHVHIQW